MICKNCNTNIEWSETNEYYYHSYSGSPECRLLAVPIMGHINRRLDAKTILAEMESRKPTPPPVKRRQPNPDFVEGVFEGSL